MKHDRTLILVRHGETEGQSSVRYYGRTDVALSELGRAQMKAVCAALERRHGSQRLARVFASPLSRAQESARLIAGNRTPIVTIEEFVEVDFGLFEGLTSDEIRTRYPAEFERWNRDKLAPAYAYPGGESRAAFAERVGRGLDRMLAIWENATDADADRRCALVVAHRGVIRAIIRRLARAEPIIDLGSIHILRHEEQWRCESLDAIDHLTEVKE